MSGEENKDIQTKVERLINDKIDEMYGGTGGTGGTGGIDMKYNLPKLGTKKITAIVIQLFIKAHMKTLESEDLTNCMIEMIEIYSSYGMDLGKLNMSALIDFNLTESNRIKIQEYLRNRVPTFHELSLRAIRSNKIDVSKLPEAMVISYPE